MGDDQHSVTTRRGFVAGLAGSVFGLAGVWKGLGLIEGGSGHSHGGPGGMSPRGFRNRLQRYLSQYRTDEGVRPPVAPSNHGHAGKRRSIHSHTIPVYLLATQWQFVPERYVLRTERTYEFRMMAADVTHGASINFDGGSRMHRLPPEQVVRDEIRFEEPGEYPVYCSYYCGRRHNRMSATLVVER